MGQGQETRPVTTVADRYRKAVIVEIDLHGEMFKVRTAGVADFMLGGSIPQPMLALIFKPTDAEQTTDPAQLAQQIEVMDRTISFASVEPKIVIPTIGEDGSRRYDLLTDGQLGAWEMTEGDKMIIFQRLMAEAGLGAKQADQFRRIPGERARSDGPVPDRERVRPAS